jgi:hypothetical protein
VLATCDGENGMRGGEGDRRAQGSGSGRKGHSARASSGNVVAGVVATGTRGKADRGPAPHRDHCGGGRPVWGPGTKGRRGSGRGQREGGPGGPQGGTQFQECQGNRQRFCGIPQRRQNRGHNTHSAHQRWFAGDARKGEGGEGGKGLGVATRRTVSRAGDLGEGGTQGIKRRQKRTHIYGRSGINRFATDKEGCNL